MYKLPATLLATALLTALQGCKPSDTPTHPAARLAAAGFDAIAASCTQFLADRTPQVRSSGPDTWVKVGHSPALVQHEVNPTESPITPFVGKIVIKDNEALATATTKASAQAITLTPDHLLSNRTHTFIYSFDGQQWVWQNGQRLTKIPGQNDTAVALTLAEVSASGPNGFARCLPR